MKIKDTISMIMFFVFAFLFVIGIAVLGSINDIPDGGMKFYLELLGATVICCMIMVLFYDYRFYARHVFALCSLITVIHGCNHNRRSKLHLYLYEIYLEMRSPLVFYAYMLKLYDHRRRNVVTVSDRLVEKYIDEIQVK